MGAWRTQSLRQRRRFHRSRLYRVYRTSGLSEKTNAPSLSALQRRGVRLHHLRSVLVSLAKNRNRGYFERLYRAAEVFGIKLPA